MSKQVRFVAVSLIAATMALSGCQRETDPTAALAWAYPTGATTTFGQPLGPGPFQVPGSKLILTRAQVAQSKGPIDWHPEDHPTAPPVVGGPYGGAATPCAECHFLNGAGVPASADLAGLPAAYIIEQVNAFRSGERKSANAGQPNTAEMIKTAQGVDPVALQQAAAYFSRLPRSRWLRVIESDTAPRTFPDKYGWLNPAPGGGSEPLGDRIVELSADLPRAMLGDDHVLLTDYVPRGAIARGKRIAETGGVSAMPCQTCHGAELTGSGSVPPIAGRPAGYIARTLWDIRTGARRNQAVAPMRAVARGLTPSEIRDVAAYLAAQAPPPPA
ncbi:c-type cytochrome [Novosphingobium sp.]|uniref:c-type cytochrome n=1 Tax=Novosphingobium sp. TaxID=1874826 RepID=UPI003BAD801A